MLRLDDTQARANLGIVVSQLIQLTDARRGWKPSATKADAIRFPANFMVMGEEAQSVIEGEKRLFEFRRASKRGQIAQLTERIGQIKEEIKGLAAQREAKNGEVALMIEELDRLEQLRKKELMAEQPHPVGPARSDQAQRRMGCAGGADGARARPDQRDGAADPGARSDHADGISKELREMEAGSPNSPSAASRPKTSSSASSCARPRPAWSTIWPCTRSEA